MSEHLNGYVEGRPGLREIQHATNLRIDDVLDKVLSRGKMGRAKPGWTPREGSALDASFTWGWPWSKLCDA